MATKLNDTERAEALARLAGWSLVDGREAIRRRYLFADFNEAFGFMTRAALAPKSWTTIRNGSTSTAPWT